MTRVPPRADYSPHEPRHRELFSVLRKAGWRPDRFVDFPDAAPGPDGEQSGLVILEDYAEAFLHAFYGLELEVAGRFGPEHLSIGYGEQWQRLDFAKNGWQINLFASENSAGTWAYPVLAWSNFVGFITDEGGVFAINDTYQVYIVAQDPFQLMDWALFRRPSPEVRSGFLERKYVPLDYMNLVWDRDLEYHLPKYRAYAVTEAGHTEYELECSDPPNVYGLRVLELKEVGSDLFIRYRRGDRAMSQSIATDLIVIKLLDEFFEGSHRARIQLIHLTDERTGESVTLRWPARRQS